jgi:hypothetical protein
MSEKASEGERTVIWKLAQVRHDKGSFINEVLKLVNINSRSNECSGKKGQRVQIWLGPSLLFLLSDEKGPQLKCVFQSHFTSLKNTLTEGKNT